MPQDSAVIATDWYKANFLRRNSSKYGSMLTSKGKLDATLKYYHQRNCCHTPPKHKIGWSKL